MNRHQSNPFLSDWDEEDLAAARAQTNSHLFEAVTGVAAQGEGQPQQQQARRSSCSQATEETSNSTRPSLYRRNMSSFEAASLQLEQHQQQMLENGSGVSMADTQKDLIAKMTADFQSAIQTNDKQFENLSFNPFDPFETIVDDDVGPNSPAPTSAGVGAAATTNHGGEKGASSVFELPTEQQIGNEAQPQKQKHDSIDDDDEELVSTPVRNIKSSPVSAEKPGSADEQLAAHKPNGGDSAVDVSPDVAANSSTGRQLEESDSIKKASLFASLLASAENTSQQQSASSETSPHEAGAEQEPQVDELEATTRVIKGSPNSAGEGSDRPVSFFDPFETVIDKDALTSLVSESQQQETARAGPAAVAGHETRLLAGRVTDSVSIETVIENNASSAAGSPAAAATAKASSDSNNNEPEGENAQAEEDKQQQLAASVALGRPSGRRLEPASGFVAPQPTPLKKRTKPQQREHQKRKDSFQEDSSDSSEEDDRIQIVICPRDASKQADKDQPVVVPLLPPPPSKSSMRQARERGQVEDMPSPIMGYKNRQRNQRDSDEDSESAENEQRSAQAGGDASARLRAEGEPARQAEDEPDFKKKNLGDHQDDNGDDDDDDGEDDGGAFVIPMTHSDDDDGDNYGKPETPLYDDDTSYVLEEYPQKYEGPGWEMMLRYPPKKKLTANRFWKKIFVKLAQVPLAPLDSSTSKTKAAASESAAEQQPQTCWALQIYDHQEDKKPMQEIPIQATYTVSEISSQLFDQFGKIFTIKLQYIFYKERVGVRQGQLARFIHTGHIGSSTTSGGHGVDPISIGAIKRMGAPIEHSPQISQIIKLGCINYEDIKVFKETLEDCLFRMPIHRDRALTTYKTEEVQMAVRDETYIEINQIGTVTKQLARVRLFFLSFLNGMPIVEVGINDFHRQGREVVGRMDILPVVTEEWIRLEAWDLHSTVDKEEFENPQARLIKLTPPDATFFELMRFRIRPPRNRELPLQISANMSVTRTKVSINCEVMVPGCVSRKHGQIPCENIAIRIQVPECWIYFFREEKHFRMGSKKSVNRRPGKVKGIERFLGGSGLQDFNDESSLIEVTSGQAKYEHHHHAVVWRAARWPKETQAAYVQNTMKIRLPLTAYDKMPENFYEYVHVEYTMPATTVSHTTLRSISVNPCDDEPPEKYVKYAAKYEYKVKMRLNVNLGTRQNVETEPEASPIVIMKQADLQDDLQREADSDDDDDDDDDDDNNNNHEANGNDL